MTSLEKCIPDLADQTGAILLKFEDNILHVISLASKSLFDTEHRYSQTGKENLALVWGVERLLLFCWYRVRIFNRTQTS